MSLSDANIVLSVLCCLVAFSFSPAKGLLWQPLLRGRVLLPPGTTSFEAELAGAEALAHSLAFFFSLPGLTGQTQEWFASYVNFCN